MITLALLAPVTAAAEDASSRCAEPNGEVQCPAERKGHGWLWGGLAALGLGAAAAGGGGGGGSADGPGAGPGPGNGGGGGGTPPPATEGGNYGNGTLLVAAGAQADWSRPVTTRVTGNARNEGQLQLSNGTLQILGKGELRNSGTLSIGPAASLSIEGEADLDNYGHLQVQGQFSLDREGSFENHHRADFNGASVALMHDAEVDNHGQMSVTGGSWSLAGDSDFDNARNGVLDVHNTRFQLRDRAGFENAGIINARGDFAQGALVDAVSAQYGTEREAITVFDNRGQITLDGSGGVLRMMADSFASHAINRSGAQIRSNAEGVALLHAGGAQATLLNQGTLTVTGNGAVAMYGERGATILNDGVINLGTVADNGGRGLVAMKSDGSATLNNRRGGVINIHSQDSFAFQTKDGGGRLINNGVVNIHGAGSAAHADAATQAAAQAGQGAPDLGWRAPRGISGYTIGTNADGSAGQLVLHDGGRLQDVEVDTGFTRGTDASTVRLEGVALGVEEGAENVRSASVVWAAQAHHNADGSVDVTMQRRNYAELAAADQAGVAAALEQGYRNDALFHSLEVADRAQFQQALHHLSGASLAASGLRFSSNGDALWSQLAALPADQHAILALGGGQQNARGVRGEGTASQWLLGSANGRSVQLMTASLKGDLGLGQEHGTSHFAGVGFTQQLAGLQLRHQFGYERHGIEGRRSLSWGDTREVASSQRQLQRTMLATTLSRDLRQGNLRWQPRLKATAFQLREHAYNEGGAGGFDLLVGAGRTQGARMELGTHFAYSPAPAWALQADLSVATALAVNRDAPLARLRGAPEQAFALPGVRSGGMDYQVSLGLHHQRDRLSLRGQLSGQRLWGQDDARAEVQVGYRFR